MLEAAERPLAHLSDLVKKHPHVWESVEYVRKLRGKSLPNWPSYCYLPIAAGISVATRTHEPTTFQEQVEAAWDGAFIAALATWRQTKGIYHFHPELLGALWDTPVTGDLPVSILKRLPEWCVYLHINHPLYTGETLYGAWAHLEADGTGSAEELRLLLNIDDQLIPIPVNLGGTLKDGIDGLLNESAFSEDDVKQIIDVDNAKQDITKLAEPVISLLLYLCSDAPEIDGRGTPGNPRPTKTKRGWRIFPANQPRAWTVGARIGATLQAARKHTATDKETLPSGRARPRPHIRRAHWALRWTGPRDQEQTPVLRWIQPTLIAANASAEELPATIRPTNP